MSNRGAILRLPILGILFDLDMQVKIERIYRVVCNDNVQSATPETYWTTVLQGCKSYIENSVYKHRLYIQEAVLTDKPLTRAGR